MTWTPGTAHIQATGHCRHCGLIITQFRDTWWTTDDDMMCPDGENQHTPRPGAVRNKENA